jgi:hypothetical protein
MQHAGPGSHPDSLISPPGPFQERIVDSKDLETPAPQPHQFHPLEGWRSFAAGFVAVAIGCYDVWHLGANEGLTVEIDEILILVGIGLIAGMPNVFLQTLMGRKQNGDAKTERTEPEPG